MANIFVDRTTTWHAIGKDVSECKDMEQVLRKSGLDYEVYKEPVGVQDDKDRFEIVSNRYVTMRNTDRHMYDVVSDKFEIIQNRQAFDFVNYMGDELQFEKAGETANGMVYVIGKLPEINVLGDKFVPHVLFRNGFTGKIKITAAICPLRIVCQNQFNFAFKNTQNAIMVRHVQNAESKLEEAREVLKMSADYMQEITKMAEQYVGIKLTEEQFEKVMEDMFPTDKTGEMNAYKRNRLETARAAFKKAYFADDNGNFRGTGWGVINAYTDFITHREPTGNTETKDEGKFMTVTFGAGLMNIILNTLQRVAA
jgi:phage/plasmid-like protein (TIGR03299 family)